MQQPYTFTIDDKSSYSYSNGSLEGFGQCALNNGHDIFVLDGVVYQAEAHGDKDFTNPDYDEECDYCYSVKKLYIQE